MNVLVDTDVWSEALRKTVGPPSPEVSLLRELIRTGGVQLIGPIRQEVLSGVRRTEQFELMRDYLRAFVDATLTSDLYEQAAMYRNLCASRGIQGSSTDFLLCACAVAWNLPILMRDQDFGRYAQHIPLRLYAAPAP